MTKSDAGSNNEYIKSQKQIENADEDSAEKEIKLNGKNGILKELIQMFPNATNNDIRKREPCKAEICKIKTKKDIKACALGRRKIEQSVIKRTKDELQKLEDAGIIRKSRSVWRSPIRPVENPDGSIRICTNLIALNEIVESESYPTPIMSDLIEKVQGSNIFSLIDLKDGYFQIEIQEEDKEKTAFKFDNLLYEWNRMPMGFKNAPSIFQK